MAVHLAYIHGYCEVNKGGVASLDCFNRNLAYCHKLIDEEARLCSNVREHTATYHITPHDLERHGVADEGCIAKYLFDLFENLLAGSPQHNCAAQARIAALQWVIESKIIREWSINSRKNHHIMLMEQLLFHI